MKKVIAMIMLLNLFVCINVQASDCVIEIIAPFTISQDDETVSRGDCIASVMKLLKVDNMTAEAVRYAFMDQPVFRDVDRFNENAGYIFIAKYSGIAYGISVGAEDAINNFEPYRDVTIKECLAFMLRCLENSEDILWDNTMEESVRIGLITNEELLYYDENAVLTNKQFYKLLSRMLNMYRYLYWPEADFKKGYAKTMQTDTTGSIRYIDQFN